MDLLKTFNKIFDSKKTEYMHNLNRLNTGLKKLSDANELVSKMKDELILLGPKIETKAKETEELMVQLLKDQEAVNEVRSIVSEQEEKMRNDTELVQKYAQEAERELNDVLPVLAAAKESLYTLRKSDISEIRVYNSPPYLVMTVMCAVCVVLQKKPDWTTAKQILADPSFLNKLIDFDKDSITDKIYLKMKQFSKSPDFTPEIVGSVSIACKSICSWILALQDYYEVYRTLKPKEAKVKEANETLDIMRNSLKHKQDMLKEIQGHLNKMEAKYQESLTQCKMLENRKELMRMRLKRSTELTTALDVEKIRWSKQYYKLREETDLIIGNCIISAAAVNYLGAMTQDYRTKLIGNWTNFCLNEANLSLNERFNLSKEIIPDTLIRNWINEELPDDQYSIENAVFLKSSLKWPLIIDPQNQATTWIKHMEGSTLKTCKSDDLALFRTVEQAIRLGQPLLIENVGEVLDPALDTILRKEILTRGGQKLLKLGDIEVDYNDSFRLYLVTSLPNPHYLPNTFIKVNLINFTITFKCLFEQFLSLVVLKERPELEAERAHLLETIANDMTTLRMLEDKSLSILSDAETSDDTENIEAKTILDDQNLIDILKQSKETSGDILERLKRNEDTEKNLNFARQKYAIVATRGAILYFVIQSLSSLNVMYQFSLNWFYTIFQSCLGNVKSLESRLPVDTQKVNSADRFRQSLGAAITKKSISLTPSSFSIPEPNENSKLDNQNEFDFHTYVNNVINHLTYTVYQIISWGLFAEHQLIFSFSLCINILKHSEDANKKVSNTDQNFFLNSAIMADLNQQSLVMKVNELENLEFTKELMIEEKVLKQLFLLEELIPEKFQGLVQNILKNVKPLWSKFRTLNNPYEFMKTDECNLYFDFHKLTNFQRLILIKLIRKERLINSIQSFILDTLGSKFINPGVPTLQDVYNLAIPQSPIIFILSPGSDPTNLLLRFAKDLRGSSLHMDIISLGQGQGPKAEELITKSLILKGRWIFLQNCHLAASFMPRLQNIVNNFNRQGADIDNQFRLFLSSKPDPRFPVPLLQAGVKMTIESPRGLKNNLRQNFGPGGLVNKKLFESQEYGENWKRLVFNLGFIHALIHERKKFGSLGWNLAYEFNNSDLEVAILQLQSVLVSKESLPFNVLKYITGEVIYGGRVTDDFDRRCLLSILSRYFCETAVQNEFYYADHPSYKAPNKLLDYNGILEFIEIFPEYDDPIVFGMNVYAEDMLLSQRADQFINSFAAMEPRETVSIIGTKQNDNEIVLKMCEEIRNLIPESVLPEFDKGRHLTLMEAFDKLKEKLGNKYYENAALLTILRQEIDRYNNLLNLIHKTIHELVRAVKGEIIISKSLENIMESFLIQKVPDEWELCSYASLKSLASWTNNLHKRIKFFSLWSRTVISFVEGNCSCINPYIFWISGFFFPQGLLTAITQNYARKLKVAIDSLKMICVPQTEIVIDDQEIDVDKLIDQENINKNENDVLIYGLYMDCGKLDVNENRIIDSKKRFNLMPCFLCKIINKDNNEVKDDSKRVVNKYICPVYRNSVRAGNPNDQAKNYIMSIELNCNETSEFWILRGVCMMLQTDD